MKRILTITLAAVSVALFTSPAKAQYTTGDLMIGFENGTTKDVLLDIGPAQMYVVAGANPNAQFAINIGNLNAALIAAFGPSPGLNPNIFMAVFGNLNPADPANTLYASQPHSAALSGSTQSARSSNMSGVESQYNNDFASQGTRAITQDSSLAPNSYLSQVTGGRAFQNYITETQFAAGAAALDRLPSTNSGAPTSALGRIQFQFDQNGNVISAFFNPVPEAGSTLVLLSLATLSLLAIHHFSLRNKHSA